ncbi:MAG: hypothetical protein HYT39_01635 [Candidatus Sungbacteria bacterium]|nr:hypothetical protein [Candidatus Sungbacteria bacterium]
MRKFFATGLVGLALLAGPTSVAQAQCLLCGVIGFAIGSSTSGVNATPQDVSGGGGAVLYIAPRISERITEPLAVRIASTPVAGFSSDTGWNYKWKGMTIQQIFEKTVKNPEQFVVLEVMRVVNPSNTNAATFWFAYLEKHKVVPLERLTPREQK